MMVKEFFRNRIFRFLAVILLVFLVFAESRVDAVGSIYIPLQRISLLTIILALLIFATLLKRRISVDFLIFGILLLRAPFYYVISIPDMSQRTAFQAHFMIILIGPIMFICIYAIVVTQPGRILEYLLKISTVVIAVQVHSIILWLFLSGHSLYKIKTQIGIPLGYSNTIASIVLIQVFLCYFLLKNRFYFVISITSLLCTFSKAAFLVFIVMMFLVLLFDAARKKRIGIILGYVAGIAILLFLLNYLFSYYFEVYRRTLDALWTNDLMSINNERMRIFTGYLEDISLRPFLGWGLGKYRTIQGMGHNLFLQSLFSGGIVGTVMYYAPIAVILRRAFRWKDKKMRVALYMVVLVAAAHGFVENVFFTVPGEFFFWLYVTLIYKEGMTNERYGVCDPQLQRR